MINVILGTNSRELTVPSDFILTYDPLSWAQALWGVRNGLITHQTLIELALIRLGEAIAPPEALIKLSLLHDEAPYDIEECTKALAALEDLENDVSLREKWLELTIAWIVRDWKILLNAPGVLENVVADFGYPDELEEISRVIAGAAAVEKAPPRQSDSDDKILQLLKQFLIQHRMRSSAPAQRQS